MSLYKAVLLFIIATSNRTVSCVIDVRRSAVALKVNNKVETLQGIPDKYHCVAVLVYIKHIYIILVPQILRNTTTRVYIRTKLLKVC